MLKNTLMSYNVLFICNAIIQELLFIVNRLNSSDIDEFQLEIGVFVMPNTVRHGII